MRKWTIFALCFAALWLAVPAAAQDDAPPPDLSAVCRDAVTGMTALTADLGWPEHLMQENSIKTEDDFDVNAYFTVLDHLAVEDGYFLDYVYQYDFMGGYPVLYAQPDNQTPFKTFDAYYAAMTLLDPTMTADDLPSYLDHIVPDDTPESYLQLTILAIMGNQFYLHWHAGHNDFQVICDEDMLDTLLTSNNEFGSPITEDVQQQARQLDVTPTVELDEDMAQVQFVGFTKWGGFYRVTYEIDRHYPRETYEAIGENLIEYNCGVMF